MLLGGIVVLLPLLVAFNVYVKMNVPLEAPGFGRTVHPAPPDTISVHDRDISLITAQNPYRELEESEPRPSRSTWTTAAASTTRTVSTATATRWPATACSPTR